jgi:hypothetical protein
VPDNLGEGERNARSCPSGGQQGHAVVIGDRTDYVGVWRGGYYSCHAFKNGALACAGGLDRIDGPDMSGAVTFGR